MRKRGSGTAVEAGRREPTEAEREFGRRLERAAIDAGFETQADVAAALRRAGHGVTQSVVSKWFRGWRRPRGPALAAFAEIVGREVHWFALPEARNPVAEALVVALSEVLWQVMEGLDLAEAYARVSVGGHGLNGVDRGILAAKTDTLREYLMTAAPGAWEKLPARERAELVRALATVVAERVTEGES